MPYIEGVWLFCVKYLLYKATVFQINRHRNGMDELSRFYRVKLQAPVDFGYTFGF